MDNPESNALAKLQWIDPVTKKMREFVLTEGATASIGRSANNNIQIAEQHVSRQHAVIRYQDGVFMINDLGSSNGTFVNENRIEEPFPLFAGDSIRLYVPQMNFLAVTDSDVAEAQQTGRIILPSNPTGQASLTITNGPQEGQTIPLLLSQVTLGRATHNATWEILLQDPSVSRPHARLIREDQIWTLIDLDSSNGTRLNKEPVDNHGVQVHDGDTLEFGSTIILFRTDWSNPENDATQS